ncbi:ribosome biogenesis protein ytm1 [Serendipita sp. 407]|nr:ribosome biogenesis protein ytm1 [Serendipita sp. 407]
MSSSETSHPVVFSTSTQHIIPSSKYLIPASWARYQLSQLINKSLQLSQPVPFDFLIRGQILRGSIAEWCAGNGVKEEETLEIEYFESLMPPKLLSAFAGEDWVGEVNCQVKGYIMTASYDSIVRVYDHSQTLLTTISGHSGPVSTSCWIPGSNLESPQGIVSGSHDGTALITPIKELESISTQEELLAAASLRLHTSPLSSVAASTSGTHILTAGWDGLLGVFTTQIPDEDEVFDDQEPVPKKKRRKVEQREAQPKRKAPVHALRSHTGKVTQGIFDKSGKNAYSCSLDSTLRTWDIEIGACKSTITANTRPMTSLVLLSDENTLLSSSTDRVVSIYDLREQTLSGPPPVLPHPAFPSTLCAHPTSIHKVASGAYDGIVRLWDLRSTKTPVNAFEVGKKQGKPGRKIMSIDWTHGLLVAGGEMGVEIWKLSEGADIARS